MLVNKYFPFVSRFCYLLTVNINNSATSPVYTFIQVKNQEDIILQPTQYVNSGSLNFF